MRTDTSWIWALPRSRSTSILASNGPIRCSASALPSLFSAEIERNGEQSPSLVLDASGEADYQVVAKVLATAQNAGLTRIKFE